MYLFGIILAPYKPDDIKNTHFECGLPATKSKPKKANFSFFIYAIMFVVVDMTGLFFSLFVYAKSTHSLIIAGIFALIMAVVISIAMREFNLKGENDAKIS